MTTTKHNWLMAGLTLSAAALVAAGAAFYFLSPAQRIALDVNPSIELETTRLEKVSKIIPLNDDAKKLLEGYTPKDNDLDDVLEDLVDRMMEQGYLANEKKNDVLITVDDRGASQKTLDKVNKKVAQYIAEKQLDADVHAQKIDMDRYDKEAQKWKVSSGKMSVIDRLLQKDPTLTPEHLADTRISDLVDYAKEHNIPLDLLEDRLDDLEDQYHDGHLDQLEDQLDDRDDIHDSDDDDKDDRDDIHDSDDDDDKDDRDDIHDPDDDDDKDDRDDIHDPDDDDKDDRDDIHDPDDDDDKDDRDDIHDSDDDDKDDRDDIHDPDDDDDKDNRDDD